MSAAEKTVIFLPPNQARYVEELVSSGAFSSENDVVIAGLNALMERGQVLDQWLQDEVIPTYDRMVADPSRAVSRGRLRERLETRHAERLKSP